MAAIVLVHGIAQEYRSAHTLEEEWVPRLARGVKAAGFPEVADRLWKYRHTRRGIDARMAFYGDLLRRHPSQGEMIDEDIQHEVTARIGREWLDRAAVRGSVPPERQRAAREIARLEGGPGETGRTVVLSPTCGLAGLRWFAADGPGSAGGFVNKALTQLTRYLTDDQTRNRVLDRVGAEIGFDTKVVIGHSLGAVVAYELAHRLRRPLPLLITLGSPLGPDTVVDSWVRPQPAQPPAFVENWVNLADRDDLVAADPTLSRMFPVPAEGGPVLRGGYTGEHGAEPHKACFYLQRREIGRSVGLAFGT
ncbi:alpha/beta fold hydrolase [Embleya sp. NPDC050154]|jgi:hypothetical protein|uniref:alpha/beta fold hydrolase n=1 Tax=unclassified Embleya TaxID=2699296 RepID=UPI0037B53AC5